MENTTRPPIRSLACPNQACPRYGQRGAGNLKQRKKSYGKGRYRLLKCTRCSNEFSERRNTALFNCKLPEAKAVALAEQLMEGTNHKATARLVGVAPETVRRMAKRLGQHGQRFHDEQVQELQATALEGDERHGYAISKANQVWEGEIVEPQSRLIVSHVQGKRDERLIRALLEDACQRLADPYDLVFFSDGEVSYQTLFPQVFGRAYRSVRKHPRGRPPKARFRLSRQQAHVQVVKQRQGKQLIKVETRLAHGSWRRVEQELSDSDAVLFVTPEYNRSIPGALKNAIDWASRPWGQNSFHHIPAGVIGASIGAIGTALAQQSLRGVLSFCNARQMTAPEAYITYSPERFRDDGEVIDESTANFLKDYMAEFRDHIMRVLTVLPRPMR
jgi:NAD(P)H-dependent FMN reductase/transposase-like protein/IS1 family transposase